MGPSDLVLPRRLGLNEQCREFEGLGPPSPVLIAMLKVLADCVSVELFVQSRVEEDRKFNVARKKNVLWGYVQA